VEGLNAADSRDDTVSNEPAGQDDTRNDTESADKMSFDHDMEILSACLARGPPTAESSPTSNAVEASTNDTTTAANSGTTHGWLSNDPGSNEGTNGQSSCHESVDIDTVSPIGSEGANQRWLTNTPGAPYDSGATTSSNVSEDGSPIQGDEGYATVAQEDGDAESNDPAESSNGHYAVYLRPSTLFEPPPTWATQYKKFFDVAVAAYRMFLYNRAPKPIRARLADPSTHEAAVKRYNLINLGLYPFVTAGHLIELQQRIGDVTHFCTWIERNMEEIQRDKEARKDIIYAYPSNSPLRFRTKGLGSSLRYVTHVDEDWADEDDWGLPPPMKKRNLI
jgi:hypothetical protein